ncbi:hypothetical protein LMG28688_07190 [Paraburkholderia caffeinitolerans]|uniref:Uncharacterized protein n=1 Tax=Paraburkholderia caffeinitolerans TaxID=1723730 RepID=A0A6J5H0X2_9BURK|nr:hypothetical protein LMG28688_07190 [Paraburkholderia caffeinitolerans]
MTGLTIAAPPSTWVAPLFVPPALPLTDDAAPVFAPLAPPLTDDAPPACVPLALPPSAPISTPESAWPAASPSDGMPALPAVLSMLMPVPESVPPATKLDS